MRVCTGTANPACCHVFFNSAVQARSRHAPAVFLLYSYHVCSVVAMPMGGLVPPPYFTPPLLILQMCAEMAPMPAPVLAEAASPQQVAPPPQAATTAAGCALTRPLSFTSLTLVSGRPIAGVPSLSIMTICSPYVLQ